MKKYYACGLVLGIIFFPGNSQAFLGFSDTVITLSYPCLGLDGVPITDATLSSQCCDGSGHLIANAPASCATSMYGGAISEPTSGTVTSISTAQSAIDQANNLNGATTNYAATSPSPSSGSSAVSSALTSGGTGSAGTSADPSLADGSGAADSGAGSGSGGGGGGGGSGDALGVAGGTGANVSPSPGVAPGEGADGGAYVNNGNGAGGAGGNGKVGGLFGTLFGSKNSKGSGDAADANFANGNGDGANGDGSGANKDGLDGTTVDPEDYFTRIDKSASLFKVVSNRYAKESERKHLGIGIAKITQ